MVYLIHFDKPYPPGTTKVQHYIGYVESAHLQRRIDHHQRGTGSCLMRAVSSSGISWQVVRTWPEGDRNFERKLKNYKKARCMCPVCNPKVKAKHQYVLTYSLDGTNMVEETAFFEIHSGLDVIKKFVKDKQIIGAATIHSVHFQWTIKYRPRYGKRKI